MFFGFAVSDVWLYQVLVDKLLRLQDSYRTEVLCRLEVQPMNWEFTVVFYDKLFWKENFLFSAVIEHRNKKENSSFPHCRTTDVLYTSFGVHLVIAPCFSTFVEKREPQPLVRCRGRVVKAMD